MALYPCDECSATFTATHSRTMHKIQEHEGRRYQTVRHKKTNSIEKYKCQICDKEFSKMVNLNKHVATHKITK